MEELPARAHRLLTQTLSFLRVVRKQMPPTEPLAVFHLAEEGAFSEGLVQAARVPDDGRGFIVVLDDDLRPGKCVIAGPHP